MKVLGIQSSPNEDGLTAKTVKAVLKGAEAENAVVELVNLNEVIIKPCMACDGGWGQCRREGTCVIDDEFQTIRDKIHAADATVFATPVYWGDLSESAKLFLDRLRRCEVKGEFKSLNGRYALGIASAGGTGNGCVKALLHLEDYMRRVGFTIFDLVTVTQVSKEHKLEMLEKAGRRLAKQK
ncbi:MAG: flavodoxin family protein [Candidatus Bathyarchaeota archaeon]|nr:flavodoxin family protein [Candidatus Bathyarchaeota archaeon]